MHQNTHLDTPEINKKYGKGTQWGGGHPSHYSIPTSYSILAFRAHDLPPHKDKSWIRPWPDCRGLKIVNLRGQDVVIFGQAAADVR